MTPEIKDMKTWDEAARWLAKHGWGIAQIEEQKAEWDKANAPKPAAKAVPTPKPAPKPVAAPAPAPEKTTTVEPKTE